MQTRNTFDRRNTVASPPRAFACDALAPAMLPSAATDDELARARQRSPTSAIDASPSTLANDRNPVPRGAPAVRPVTRFGVVRHQRTDRSDRESAPCKARPPASDLKRASLSRESALPRWSVVSAIRPSPRLALDPPRERTSLGTSQDAFHCAGSVRFYSTRIGRNTAGLRPPLARLLSLVTRTGR